MHKQTNKQTKTRRKHKAILGPASRMQSCCNAIWFLNSNKNKSRLRRNCILWYKSEPTMQYSAQSSSVDIHVLLGRGPPNHCVREKFDTHGTDAEIQEPLKYQILGLPHLQWCNWALTRKSVTPPGTPQNRKVLLYVKTTEDLGRKLLCAFNVFRRVFSTKRLWMNFLKSLYSKGDGATVAGAAMAAPLFGPIFFFQPAGK